MLPAKMSYQQILTNRKRTRSQVYMFRTQAKTLKSTLPLHTRTFIQHFTKLCILHLAHSSFLDFKSVRAASEVVISTRQKRWEEEVVKRCLPVTDRKLELGRIRTLARRHDVSRMSGGVEPDLHIADSLQHKPTPHLSEHHASVWHKLNWSPTIRTRLLSGRVPQSFPNNFSKICSSAKLKLSQFN